MPTPKILVFTATAGYRHESIPDAIKALKAASVSASVQFDFTEDGSYFTDGTLAKYDSLMFVSNTGEVLNAEQREAMARYFRNGGGYVGVHSASACLYDDKIYDKVVGAHFDYHPKLQEATFKVLDKNHPSTAHLPDAWRYEEEVYIFRSDPRNNGVHVLMSVEEGSYENNGKSTGDYPTHGDPHPIAWYNTNPQSSLPLSPSAESSGRSFYTSLGHNSSTWEDDNFVRHVLGGLSWVLDAKSTRAFGHGCVGNTA